MTEKESLGAVICCGCGNAIKKKKDAYMVKNAGIVLWFERPICLSVWIDNLRRLRAQAAGLEFRS